MTDLWWFLSRATGIVATVLAVAALVWGFFFSSRNTGTRLRPAWWLDLHNWLGGLALVFTAAHLLTVFVDSGSRIGLMQIFVPNTATGRQWAMTWGVVATYIFVLVVFTSWPRRRFSKPVWRILHLTSVAGVVLAGLHAYQAGTDGRVLASRIGLLLATAIGTYALGLRLFSTRRKSRAG
jgi:predicted ferric reductase